MKEIRYDPEKEITEVEWLGFPAWTQRAGDYWGYWAEKPKPGELADEVVSGDGEIMEA